MSKTTLSQMVNPEVLADMISAKLPAQIKFSTIAKIDNTLTARAGNTITIPTFNYIGDAEDVPEGTEITLSQLTTTTSKETVKKVGKAVELTDEAILSGYGDPLGEVANQLALSIAAKVDKDCLTALDKATLTYDGISNKISYTGIVNALDKLQEEDWDIPKVLFIHPSQVTTLRLDPDFKDIYKYPEKIMMTGVIGTIAGCQVIPSKNIKENSATTGWENYIVQVDGDNTQLPALTIFLKRDIELEKDRDILAKTTVLSADEHYVAALTNAGKVVKATFLK